MILSSGIHLGRVTLLQTAGGCMQHAKGLLVSLMAAAEQQAAGSSGQQGSNPASWRSISTTRGIYMGRVFIRENLVKSATPSTLYTRDNYQFLSDAKWSLNACEQVLANHQAAHNRRPQGRPAYDPINKALNERIRSTTTLAELRQVVAEQAHRMSQINLAVVIQRVPQLLHNRAGAEEFDAAALLLDHAAKLLLPKLQWLSGPNICSCLAAFAKCRYGPSSDMLQALSGQLLAEDCTKLQRCKLSALAQLMHAQGKFMQGQAQWPLLQAIMEQVMAQLERLPPNAQQQQQQQDEQRQQQDEQRQQAEAARDANAVAQLAWLLERSQLQSQEFLAALHRWIAAPVNMQHLSTLSLTQLWAAVRAAAAAEGDDTTTSSSSSSSSGGGSMPEWVVALADDVSGRLAGMKPREVAHLVAGYAALPGAAAHQGLFAAAAAHIEAHAHMFTSFNDMEMVAAAFEKTDFKAGLAALKALQQQAEQMAASKY
ncbi:hypothetical protein OEZ85_013926 [Tetradesmus obliquus]|uniref:Uncharacterized protein n=1 Tax=Tetradesmus obliquus TaxID=3088 RepID=A0ABY8U6E0_TETOB|nr:hypothetical protein OEZ85_013926 [Tetradesmus obliquus]